MSKKIQEVFLTGNEICVREKLERLLHERRSLIEFKNGIKNTAVKSHRDTQLDYLIYECPDDEYHLLIKTAFDWSKTPDGYVHWDIINDAWQETFDLGENDEEN